MGGASVEAYAQAPRVVCLYVTLTKHALRRRTPPRHTTQVRLIFLPACLEWINAGSETKAREPRHSLDRA